MVQHACDTSTWERQKDQEFKASLGYVCIGTLSQKKISGVPVAHTCNPSYSGGRDQEDNGSKPARANSSERPCLK
jgi:hypothetical protein